MSPWRQKLLPLPGGEGRGEGELFIALNTYGLGSGKCPNISDPFPFNLRSHAFNIQRSFEVKRLGGSFGISQTTTSPKP
jgi:hypothetical protein